MNIYWFYHELSRAVENTRETALGLGKIEFWADSVEKIFDVISPLFQCLMSIGSSHQRTRRYRLTFHLQE